MFKGERLQKRDQTFGPIRAIQEGLPSWGSGKRMGNKVVSTFKLAFPNGEKRKRPDGMVDDATARQWTLGVRHPNGRVSKTFKMKRGG